MLLVVVYTAPTGQQPKHSDRGFKSLSIHFTRKKPFDKRPFLTYRSVSYGQTRPRDAATDFAGGAEALRQRRLCGHVRPANRRRRPGVQARALLSFSRQSRVVSSARQRGARRTLSGGATGGGASERFPRATG